MNLLRKLWRWILALWLWIKGFWQHKVITMDGAEEVIETDVEKIIHSLESEIERLKADVVTTVEHVADASNHSSRQTCKHSPWPFIGRQNCDHVWQKGRTKLSAIRTCTKCLISEAINEATFKEMR